MFATYFYLVNSRPKLNTNCFAMEDIQVFPLEFAIQNYPLFSFLKSESVLFMAQVMVYY